MTEKWRIGIVDDDPAFLYSLSLFLNREEDMEVAGTAADRAGVIELVKTCRLDFILMDLNLSDNKYDGIFAAMEILELCPCKIIMITSLEEKELVLQSFTAGAVQYISKKNYKQLPHAIRTACSDFNPLEILVQNYGELKQEQVTSKLSQAEKGILDLLQQGFTQAQIEKILFKSTSTVKNQVGSMLRKLGVSTSKEAIKKMRNKGVTGL